MIGMIVMLILLAILPMALICALLTVWVRDDYQATMRADDANNNTDLLRAAADNTRLLSGGSRLKGIAIWLWLAPKLLAYWIRSA